MSIRSTMNKVFSSVVSMTLVLQPMLANAQRIVVDTTTRPGAPAPTVGVTGNGVDQVNIATPNGAGLSHNQYQQYNVGPNGLILNNSTGAVNTKIGGVVYANPNLRGQPAKIILNEVTGAFASLLGGVTEVAGTSAEVIVANPNGITCAGCGYINTSRATLTTGTPSLGADGSLHTLNVQNGTIDFQGAGGNFTNVPVLDIVSRRVVINAPVNGQTIRTTAGNTSFNYANGTGTKTAATAGTPQYAIDTSAMGGMYANRIMLNVTEAGAGVRIAGNMASNAGDLTLTSTGQLLIQSGAQVGTTVSGNVALHATGLNNAGLVQSAGSAKLALSNGLLTNSGTIAATGGGLAVHAGSVQNQDQGALYAANTLRLTVSGQLSNSSTGTIGAGGNLVLTAASLVNNGKIGATGVLTGTVAGDVTNTGILFGQSGIALTLGGTLDNSGGQLGATTGNVILSGPTSTVTGNATAMTALINNGGSISAGDSTLANPDPYNVTIVTGSYQGDAGGLVSATGALTLVSTGDVASAGHLTGGTGFSLLALGAVTNSGTMGALAGPASVQAGGVLTNSGLIGAQAGDVAVSAASLVNTGTLTASGATTVTLTGLLSNASGAAIAAGTQLTILAGGSVTNAGQISGGTGLSLTTTGSLDNQATGVIGATIGNVAITAGNTSNEGAIEAPGGNVTLNLASLTTSATSVISESGILSMTLTGPVTLNGTLDGTEGFILSTTGALTNNGKTGSSEGNVTIIAGDTVNNGTIASNTGDTSLVTNALTNNAGAMISAGGAMTVIAFGAVTNAGTLVGTTGLTLSSTGTLTNDSQIGSAKGTVAIGATDTSNSGKIVAASGDLILSVTSLANTGTLVASGNTTIAATGLVSNSGNGLIGSGNAGGYGIVAMSGGDLTLSAGQLSNTATAPAATTPGGTSGGSSTGSGSTGSGSTGSGSGSSGSAGSGGTQAGGTPTPVTGGNLTVAVTGNATNASVMFGQAGVNIGVGGVFDNSNGSITSFGGNVIMAGYLPNTGLAALINTGGSIQASSGNVTIATGSYFDAAPASLVTAGHLLTLTATGAVTTQGNLQGGTDTTVTPSAGLPMGVILTADALTNDGQIVAAQGNLAMTAGNTLNTGTMQASSGALTLAATSLANSGTILANTTAALTVSGAVSNSGVGAVIATQTGALTLSAGSLNNSASPGTDSKGNPTPAGIIAATTLSLMVSGNTTNSSALYGQTGLTGTFGGAVDNSTGSITVKSGDIALTGITALTNTNGTIQAVSGNVSIATGSYLDTSVNSLVNAGHLLTLTASGAVATQGVLIGGTDTTVTPSASLPMGLTLNAGGPLTNAGEIAAQQGALSVTAGDTQNSGAMVADSGLLTLHAGALSNSGTISATGNQLILTAASLTNSSSIFAQTNATLTVAGAVLNQGAGTAIGTGSGDLTLTAGSLSNTATVGSNPSAGYGMVAANHLMVTSGGTTSNSSLMFGTNGVTISSGGLLDNSNGAIQAGTAAANTATQPGSQPANLTITSGGYLSTASSSLNASGATHLTATGTVTNAGFIGGDTGVLVSTTGALANSNAIWSHFGDVTIGGGASSNSGTIESQSGALTLTAASLANSGTIAAANAGNFTVAGLLQNAGAGAVISANGLTIAAGSLQNTATSGSNAQAGFGLISQGALAVTVAGDASNASVMFGAKGTSLSVGGTLDNSGGIVQAGTNGAAAQNLTITTGSYASNTASALTATGTTSLTASGAVSNNGGISGNNGVTLSGGTTTNTGTIIASNGGLSLTAAALDNSGAIQSLNAATLQIAGLLSNHGISAVIGTVAGDLTLTAGSLQNTATAGKDGQGNPTASGILSSGMLTATVVGDVTNSSILSGKTGLTLSAGGALDNTNGTIVAGTPASSTTPNTPYNATITAASYTANAPSAGTGGTAIEGGVIAASGIASLAVTGTLTNNGTVSGDTGVTTSAGSTFLNGGTIVTRFGDANLSGGAMANSGTMASVAGNLTLNAASLSNTGAIQASQSATLTVAGLLINQGIGALIGSGTGPLTVSAGTLQNLATVAPTPAGASQPNGYGLISGATLALTVAGDVSNSSVMLGVTGLTLKAGGAIDNSGGTIVAGTTDKTGAPTIVANAAITGGSFIQDTKGDVQATGTLTLTGNNFLTNNGGALLGQGGITLATNGQLLNGGTIAANNGNVTITSGGNAANSGLILANSLPLPSNASPDQITAARANSGNITLNAANFSNQTLSGATSVAQVEAVNSATFTIAGLLNNVGTGTVIEAGGLLTINAGTLYNATNLGDPGTPKLNGIIAGGLVVNVTGDLTNTATGLLQGQAFAEIMVNGRLSNNNGFILSPNGNIYIGGIGMIGAGGAVSNSVYVNYLDNTNGLIEAKTASTDGSSGNVMVNAANFVGSGTGNGADQIGLGTISGASSVSLSTQVDLRPWSNLLAGSLVSYTTAGTFNVGATETLAGVQDVSVTANTINNAGSIYAPGVAYLQAAGNINNTGLIYGTGSFNATTGIHQAGIVIALDGTLTNSGAILSDIGSVFIQGWTGKAATEVDNFSGLIQSTTGDVSITAKTFVNEVAGGVTLQSGVQIFNQTYSTPASPSQIPPLLNLCASCLPYYNQDIHIIVPDPLGGPSEVIWYVQDGASSIQVLGYGSTVTLNGAQPLVQAGGNLAITAGSMTNAFGHIQAGGDISLKGGSLNNLGYTTQVTYETQCPQGGSCRNAIPADPSLQPPGYEGSPAWQLGAGQAHAPNFWFTINGVSVAGSIVAGGSIYGNFTGTVDNTTLIANSGAPLATYNNISSLPGTGIAGLPRSDGAGGVVFNGNGGLGLLATLPGGIPSTAALQAGQNAGTLNQAGGNNSGHNGANGTVSGQNNTGGQVNGQAVAITASAVIKALPGGAALFSVDGNPGAKYLITSNPALAAAGTFVGGTYLFQKLGLNGANLPPLLGDAYFDTSYVEQQILAATGRVYLGSVPQTPAAEIQSLLDEAARQAPLLGLETGVDLTPAQQAALTSPIVWYVDRVVNGETVLVPEVYLPSGDANTVLTDGGTISGGKDVAINAGTINNSGAIDAGKQLQLTAKGDIVNNGGTLNGGTDTFISAGGSVYNNSIANSWATTGGTASALQAVGSIASGGDLVITAGADVVSLGGTFASVGTTEMVAGGTIELGTLGLDANDHTVTPGLVTDFSAHTNFAGGVMAGGDMIMAAGNDIDLTAQPLVVGGNADLLAGGSVNFNTATDTESFKQVGNSSGLFSSHSFMDATATSTVDGTSLLAGGDVLLASGVTFKKGAPALVPALAASSSFSGGDTVPANQAGALAGAGTGAGGTNPQIVGNDGVPGSGQNTGSNNTGSSNTGSSPGTQKPPPPPMTVTLADGSTLSLPVNRQQEAILANARPTAGNGKDVTLTAATLMAGGAINVATAGNFVATTGQDTATTTTESEKTGFSFAPTAIGLAAGWSEHSDSNFSTSTETNPIGTTLLGQTISVVSNGDMLLHGATLFATGTPSKPGNITLNADGNITIDAATQTLDTAASNKTMVAGDYMAGLSPSTGVSSASVNTTSQYTIPVGSTLDATGTISITAGKALTVQDGMLNAGGDMTLTGGSVFIGAATGTSVQTNDQNSNQAGVSGKAAGLLGAAANAAYAATQENDQKLAGLDAANALWSIVQAKIMSTAVTVAEVDVEVGANGSSSQQTTTTNTAFGSTLNAGGLLTIKANGQNGSNGNLTVQGSTLDAANITLHAKNDILLNSAQNVSTMTGTTSNYGGAIGVFAQVGSNTGVGIVAEASGGAGHENGTATTQTNTTITTPGILTITSGGNTTLAGATANAGTITADIGGNLTINSVPNTQSIDSNSAQAGGTLHVGFSTNIVEVSGNAAVSMVNGNASTVPVQSGLNASKDIILNVGGTTALNGGVIRAPSGSINTGAFTFSNLDTYSSYTGFALGVAGGGVDGGVDTGSTSSLPLVGVGIDTGGANGHANAAVGNGIIINTSSGSNLTGLSRDPPNANDNVGTLPSLTDLKNNLDFTVGAMTLAEDIGSNPVVQDFVANAAQNVGTFIGNAAQSIGTAANNVLQSIIGDSNNGGTGQVTVLADTTNDGKPYQIASVGSVLNDAANGALKGAAAGAAAGATYGATGGTIVEPGGGTVVGAVGGGLVGGVIGGVLGWVYGAWQSYMTPTSPASAPPTNTGNKDPAYVPPASPGFTPTDPTQTPTDPTAVPPAPAVTPPTDTGNKQPPAVAPPTQVNNTSTDQAIDNITKGLPDVSNPGASEQSLQKGGGSGAAQADFDSLAAVPGATVKMAGSTQVVVLPDGSTAGLYDQAKSTGQPTIQINRPGGSSIKIRY